MSDTATMNGGQTLITTLVECGVEVCFANPGTSEMHFVAALDHVPEMRGVLGLFEGVVTGAADGYGRVAGKPAATLLHLGPGLGNGIANLHNAKRARTPVVNIVGDHATHHRALDAPLQSDIASLAGPVSAWYRSCEDPAAVRTDAAQAVAAAIGPPGAVATLVLPADVSWSPVQGGHQGGGSDTRPAPKRPAYREASTEAVQGALKALHSGEPAALLVGGSVVGSEIGLREASRVAQASGAKLLSETFPALLRRGAGIPAVERLAYLAELTALQLDGVKHLVLVDAKAPVSFFAYPGRPGYLVPDGCEVHVLAEPGDDARGALSALADALGAARDAFVPAALSRPDVPTGTLDSRKAAAVIGALLPEDVLVSDEANTSGIFVSGATQGCPPHDFMCLTGGAIGQGLPVATGAAIAAPERKVLCLEADGSAMYTAQALWTQAHEGLDVTTVIFKNNSYAVLEMELARVGAEQGGPRATGMLELVGPELDFVALAASMGVPASRATTAEELHTSLARALGEPGPRLIEALVGRAF